jgi:hypothetical protein
MGKVYIVTTGTYSDYQIRAVFTKLDLANIYFQKFQAEHYDDNRQIEVYETDPMKDNLRNGLFLYRVTMDPNGNTEDCTLIDFDDSISKEGHRLYARTGIRSDRVLLRNFCYARSEEHAVKITNELRIMLIASAMLKEER